MTSQVPLEIALENLKSCVKYIHPATEQKGASSQVNPKVGENFVRVLYEPHSQENSKKKSIIPESITLETKKETKTISDIKSWIPHPPFSKNTVEQFITNNNVDREKYIKFFTQYRELLLKSELNSSADSPSASANMKKDSDELVNFYKKESKNVCLPLLFYSNMIVSPDLLTADYIITNWERNYFILNQKFTQINWFMPYLDISSSSDYNIDANCAQLLKKNETVMQNYKKVYMIFFDYLGYKLSGDDGKTIKAKGDSTFINFLVNITSQPFIDSFVTISKSLKTLGLDDKINDLKSGLDFWINYLNYHISAWTSVPNSSSIVGDTTVTDYKKGLLMLKSNIENLKSIIQSSADQVII